MFLVCHFSLKMTYFLVCLQAMFLVFHFSLKMTYFFGMSQSYVFGMSYSFKRANTFLVYNYMFLSYVYVANLCSRVTYVIQETYLEYTKNIPKILCEYM